MQQKQYHIVFGQIAKATLIKSELLNLAEIEIICLEDQLSIAPLCDLNSDSSIEKRKKWFSNTFETSPFDDSHISDVVDKDIESINKLIDQSEKMEEIYLWTGFDASEIVGTARFLYYLLPLDKKIHIANYPNIPLKSIHGNTIYPPTLYTTAVEQVNEVLNHFRLLSKTELKLWCDIWAKALPENSLIRVLNKNGEINGEDESYFDSYLLFNCQAEFQTAARVIVHTLVDIEFGVGDSYLNWRLKQLVAMNKLEACGTLKEIRDYKVRLIVETTTDS